MRKAWLAAALLLVTVSPTTAMASPPTADAKAAIQDGKIEINGVQYHYLIAHGRGEPIVLLHGWGETSYMWRYVMPALIARGHTVIAPDIRGLGDTGRPADGYEKANVARDVHALVAALGLGARVTMVGHDIGGMIAYAYAAQYRSDVSRLVIMDVPLPGVDPWKEISATPRTWHFKFFGVRDLPEMLITGQEGEFIRWFRNVEAVNTSALTPESEDYYAVAYARPGALRGGFEYYRAFAQDELDNREFSKKPLAIPVLGVGASGGLGETIGILLRNVATDVKTVTITDSGHWVAEEQPQQVIAAVSAFIPAPVAR
ncbi:alpha/beta fold hydrolase [Sphingomonas sp. IC081]|uniref:alpha/beta fold hydrolase n=1 Tax=Sphingomonas sp. IC081 TaxID=304378 RepID=UPI001159BC11|nr:alpha/beta hydrolase [Sphingomonas sp. IC081]QDK34927.1 alpha/beta hydrolase [Sphingomonas sp. IC081]